MTLAPGEQSVPGTPRVLVVGAGPAGLALGYELSRRGVPFRILERGHSAGESFLRMPERLRLISPWRANLLPGLFLRRPCSERATREEYASYLRRHAEVLRLPIRFDTNVLAVRRTASGGFAVETPRETLETEILVSCAGYFSNPRTPTIDGASTSRIVQLHFAGYRDADALRERLARNGATSSRVLVVGQRLSAGQLIVELVEAGYDVRLSHRSPLRFASRVTRSSLWFCRYPDLERAILLAGGAGATGFRPKMESGAPRRLLESGRVRRHPEIVRFEERTVRFVDGSSAEVDAVVYATGFQPALGWLAGVVHPDDDTGRPRLSGMESEEAPGLFFLGLDGLRNFRSRFVRGLREDAPILAAAIVSRLRGSGGGW